MVMAGLLAAASPVLGAFGAGSGQSAQPDTSSAQATVTTNTSLSTGAMGNVSGVTLIAGAVLLYLLFGGRKGKAVDHGQE